MDTIHHVAITVKEIGRAVTWYENRFNCKVVYRDETWAMLEFGNIQLALVLPGEHPAHVAFVNENANDYGQLTQHRDGVRSIYIQDSEGNAVEILDPESLETQD